MTTPADPALLALAERLWLAACDGEMPGCAFANLVIPQREKWLRVAAEARAAIGERVAPMGRPLVESATASGRYVHVTTYRDGPGSAIRASLLFHTPEDAAACARVLTDAKVPR